MLLVAFIAVAFDAVDAVVVTNAAAAANDDDADDGGGVVVIKFIDTSDF